MITPGQRRLWALALLLALVVVGASSYLRLASNGLGCTPWPSCYGSAAAAEQAGSATLAQALRAAHRIAASAFLGVAVVLIWRAWRGWSAPQRRAGAALLAVTLLLAVVGRYAPSPLPWVTWVNVLGGFALVALLLFLRAAPAGSPSASRVPALLLVLLFMQSIGGTLISSRLAASACAPACALPPGGNLLALWDPLRAGTAIEVAGAAGGAALLQQLHRGGGLILALALALWSIQRHGWRSVLAWAAAATLALGFVLAEGSAAAWGAAHALAAALLAGGCAAALRRAAGRAPVPPAATAGWALGRTGEPT